MFCTIIIPIYNPIIERFEKLLESIESQTCRDFDVLFINDNGSTDFKNSIKEKLKDTIFEIVDLQKNIGQGLARQFGIEKSNSEWITFVDQDDTLNINAIKNAKNIIEQTNCFYVLSTKSIIANDYNWVQNGLYNVDDSVSVLHGKFYNKEMLSKYNIHFSDKVRIHEDTFFQNLVYGYQMLSEELYSKENSIINADVITYNWYLWNNSTSHTKKFNSIFGKIGYLESGIKEYVIATTEAYKEVTSKYEPTDDFIYAKLTSFLYFIYWFESAFEYINPIGWKKDNLLYIRDAVNFVMKEFKIFTIRELTNILKDVPSVYRFTYDEVLNNIQDPFIPLLTVEEYFQTINSRIEEFGLENNKKEN